ncbi:unnamed protein product [Clonostachys rosea]|uniref:Uncharacterized protein n=1 Tax=Bionectria ochroleuca TaxID=29856 RepID=A0ABY6V493_BIOOC|nr:unnamed protein product [Clonostachys rosea]
MLDLDAFDRLCDIKDGEKPSPWHERLVAKQPTTINNEEVSKLDQNTHQDELDREPAEHPELKRHDAAVDEEKMEEELRHVIHLDRVEDFASEPEWIKECDFLMDGLDQQMEEIALRRLEAAKKQGWGRWAMAAAAILACMSILRELASW